MIKAPDIVNEIVNTVSKKLGREAIFRKVNNREEYFILDLAFSYFQKADRNRRNDYRSGYLLGKNDTGYYLLFIIAHTPVMLSFFRNNFDYDVFKNILINTSKYRSEHFLRIDKGEKKSKIRIRLRKKSLDDFFANLDDLNKKDFTKTYLAKSNKNQTGIDNILVLLIAKDIRIKDVAKIIDASWNLFLWLYPSKPVFKRNASLNRSLQKIERNCEIDKIKNLPKSILKISCSGQIEGAHIKPHKCGGSDKLENGVWLCNQHHRLTEGKLGGKRELNKFEVKYTIK